ncbi:uncharacterized protein Dyak_GE16649 [Drosophila yakuba]|uniref:Uncharacterized protein n=1 Tax=Drosophila yakuba TaxID=7245 RepID=A0A0R1EF31_DROYA|nr:uncharacterized protein Dyak_GE16649 [Drosophila yakuba]
MGMGMGIRSGSGIEPGCRLSSGAKSARVVAKFRGDWPRSKTQWIACCRNGDSWSHGKRFKQTQLLNTGKCPQRTRVRTLQHSAIAPAPENNKRLINKNIKFSAQGASAAAGTGTGRGRKQYSRRTPTERTALSVEQERVEEQDNRGQRIATRSAVFLSQRAHLRS